MKRAWPALVLVMAFVSLTGAAQAATVPVNTTTDEHDVAANASCSLREAISSINFGADFGGCVAAPNDWGTNDMVNLPTGTYTLTLSGVNEEMNAFGDLDVTRDMTITGTGNPIINQTFVSEERVLDMPEVGDSLTLNGLTISGGEATGPGAPGNQGGNILFRGDSSDELRLNNVDVLGGIARNSGGDGGGIAATNGGHVFIQPGSLIQNNIAGGTAAGTTGRGGGIYIVGAGGALTVTDSEIRNNDAGFNGGAATIGRGGGVFLSGSGTTTITLTNSVIDGNRAAGGTSIGSGQGGGLFVTPTGANTLTADGLALTNNTAGGGSGWAANGDSQGFGGGLFYEPGPGSAATLTEANVLSNKAGGNGDRGNGSGGGIHTTADLNLVDSVVSSNHAGIDNVGGTSGAPDLFGTGGGISVGFASLAKLTVMDSSFNSNLAGENLGEGGAIADESQGAMVISDSSIRSNAAGANGAMGTAQGGGIYRLANGSSPADEITNTTISGNTTRGAGGGFFPGVPQGAGIASFMLGGSMAIDSSTISGNTATGENGNPVGGGLYLDTTASGAAATYMLTNSTVSGNAATSAIGDGANGGGIAAGANAAANPPNVTLTHVTVAGNTASLDSVPLLDSGRGGNVFVGSGTDLFDLRATIIADGTSGVAGTENCGLATPGLIQSLGENVEDTTPTQCELDGLGDQVGVDPLLAPLTPADGGDPANAIPTATMALLAGSPAIDSVPTGCPATDQRGVARPQGVACDVGAYEFPDLDGDGIVSGDGCPSQPGPASNVGCPAVVLTPPVTQPPPAATTTPKKKKCKKKKKRKGAAAAKKCKKRKK